jgi:hypothetical protein
MIEIEKRLEIYKKALNDFKTNDGKEVWEKVVCNYTSSGFCLYFNKSYGMDFYNSALFDNLPYWALFLFRRFMRGYSFKLEFPELYAQKPKTAKLCVFNWQTARDDDAYWFPRGSTSRIICLENAIRCEKNKINK